MVKSEIESPPPARNVVFRHAPGRTVVFVAVTFAWVAWFGLQPTLDRMGPSRLAALVVACAAAMAYIGLAVAVQSIRGIPLLQASEAGIAINNPWGRMLVRWPDTEEFSVGSFRGLRIRLREGARPIGSMWSIAWSYSMALIPFWERGIILVPTLTAVAAPTEIAEALASLRSRYVPVERAL